MDDTDRIELAQQLFALMTMRLEDAAALATDGQAPGRALAEQSSLADRIEACGDDVVLLARAVRIATG